MLEVMNQTNERVDKRKENLEERERHADGTRKITNRAYNGEWGRLGLLRPLFRDCLFVVSFVPLGGGGRSRWTIPDGSTFGCAGTALASASLAQRMVQKGSREESAEENTRIDGARCPLSLVAPEQDQAIKS